MSYLAPEHKISPRMFKLISLTRGIPISDFAKLCERAIGAFCSDGAFCEFAEAFSGFAGQRFPLLGALLYFGRATALLGKKKHSPQLLLVVCYEIACEMYGTSVPAAALSAMSGISIRRIAACQVAVCEMMQFEFFVDEQDFDRFLDYFYDDYREEIVEFLEGQVHEIIMAPREITSRTIREFEDQMWFRQHDVAEEQRVPFCPTSEQQDDAVDM